MKPVYLLQKIEIPGNDANPGNDEYERKKNWFLFIFDFLPTNLQEKFGTIRLSRVAISIFRRKPVSYPATLSSIEAEQLR